MLFPIVMMAFLLGMVLAIALHARKRGKARIAALVADLSSEGWSFDQKPSVEAKLAAWNALARPKLGRDHAAIQWIVRGTRDGTPVIAFEHRYVVSTGKSTTVITHTLAGIAGVHGLPTLSVARRYWWHRLAGFFGKKYTPIDDGGLFDTAFIVVCTDAVAARAILSQSVREWALAWLHPRAAMLVMSAQGLTVVRRASLAPPDIEDLTHQPTRVLAAFASAAR
jgi:hypothetical protein